MQLLFRRVTQSILGCEHIMKIRQRGIITETLIGGRFQVALQEIPDHTVLTRPSGKMRKRKIALCLGDDVTVEMSPYDLEQGRIIYRH